MKYFALKNHSAAKCCVCVLPGSEVDQHTEQPLMQGGGASFTLQAILQHRPFKTMQDIIHAQCKQGKNIQRSAQMLNRARWFPAETRGGGGIRPRHGRLTRCQGYGD